MSSVISDSELDILKAQMMIEKHNQQIIIDSWTAKNENLLEMWSQKAAGYRWLHMQCASYYKRVNNFFSYPIIIFSSVVGVGGFAIITKNPDIYEIILQYIFCIINLIVAILSSCQKFNKCAENYESHASSAIQYAKFYRQIKMELSLSKEDRSESVSFCKSMKNEYDKILTISPEILVCAIDSFNLKFPHVTHKPDVANGLVEIENNYMKNHQQDVELRTSLDV